MLGPFGEVQAMRIAPVADLEAPIATEAHAGTGG